MSDILELNDADFAQKMEGLVHEAEQALGTRHAKAPEPEPVAPPEPEPQPVEPPRVHLSLPELIKPLVQGVQAIGRATSEHTQILARVDKKAADDAVAQRELPQVVADLRGLLEQRSHVSRQMFDALHEELKTYKDGFLLDTVHRPMIRDLITLYDDLTEIHRQTEEVIAGAPGTAGPWQGKMDNLEAHLAHHLEFILEVLARLEVQRLAPGVGKLDKRTQRAVAVEIAEDPDQDMDIVRMIKYGFLWKERVVRPEEVVVRKWKEGFLVALQSTPA